MFDFDYGINDPWGTVGFGRLAVFEKQQKEKERIFLQNNWADQPEEDLLKELETFELIIYSHVNV